jgi:hypothetical protein
MKDRFFYRDFGIFPLHFLNVLDRYQYFFAADPIVGVSTLAC